MKRTFTAFSICMMLVIGISLGIVQPAAAQADDSRVRRGYAALGDSVAAGLGLPLAAGEGALCGRSNQAYPYRIAKSVNMPLKHIACSEATVGDLVTKQSVEGPNIPAQLDSAFAGGVPKLITITAGANDAHWAEFLRICYYSDCDNKTTSALANAYMYALKLKLYYALSDIRARSSGNPPEVYMTGYYNPLSARCSAVQSRVTPGEISWIANETKELNSTIREVTANYSFVTFVPISFSGHDICSATPWVQTVSDTAPFHPTARGQQVIANTFTTQYKPVKIMALVIA